MSGIISDNQGRSSGLVKSTTVAAYDDNKLQMNVALLGFKTAVNGSLSKYNLVDQIIDEYTDDSGVDIGASSNIRKLSDGFLGGTAGTDPSSGTVTTPTIDGQAYRVHTYLSGGTFVVASGLSNSNVDILVVAGGGGTSDAGGGGGAGGLKNLTGQTVDAGTTNVVIGVGGTARSHDSGLDGEAGDHSHFGSISCQGGGGGCDEGPAHSASASAGMTGGSGGGTNMSTRLPGRGIPGQGYGGGVGFNATTMEIAGGGGGASEEGINGVLALAGKGGDGIQSNIDGLGGTGSVPAGGWWYAGGGGGHAYGGDAGSGAGSTSDIAGLGGKGGGGGGRSSYGVQGLGDTGNARNNGTNGGSGASGPAGVGGANTGGGGGGGTNAGGIAGTGGSGIVIVRYIAGGFTTAGANLTLQSTDATASTANPDYADMIVLMENTEGTATLNTDIKGYISEDSGSTFTQGTLVEEGTWGTDKKIIAFHDLDISAQSGSAMCYKITTHNQSAGSKETKIHATSIGWR